MSYQQNLRPYKSSNPFQDDQQGQTAPQFTQKRTMNSTIGQSSTPRSYQQEMQNAQANAQASRSKRMIFENPEGDNMNPPQQEQTRVRHKSSNRSISPMQSNDPNQGQMPPNYYYPQHMNNMMPQYLAMQQYHMNNPHLNYPNPYMSQGFDPRMFATHNPYATDPQEFGFNPQMYNPNQGEVYHHNKSQSVAPRKNQTVPIDTNYNEDEKDEFVNPQLALTPKNNTKKQPKPIIIMNIDIGGGKKVEIRIFENDDPVDVAADFCDKYGLPAKVVKVLAKNITAKIEEYNQKKSEAIAKKSLNSTLINIDPSNSFHESMQRPPDFGNPKTPRGLKDSVSLQKMPVQSSLTEGPHPYPKNNPGSFPNQQSNQEDEPYYPKKNQLNKSMSKKSFDQNANVDQEDDEVRQEFNKSKNQMYSKIYENGAPSQPKKIADFTDNPGIESLRKNPSKSLKTEPDDDVPVSRGFPRQNNQQQIPQQLNTSRATLEINTQGQSPWDNELSNGPLSARSTKSTGFNKLFGEVPAKKKFQPNSSQEDDEPRQKQAVRIVDPKAQEMTYERLYNDRLNKERFLAQKKAEAEQEEIYDKNTGQKFFQPVINKHTKNTPRAQNKWNEDPQYYEEDPYRQYNTNQRSQDNESDDNRKMVKSRSNKSFNKAPTEPERNDRPLQSMMPSTSRNDRYIQPSNPMNRDVQRDASPMQLGGYKLSEGVKAPNSYVPAKSPRNEKPTANPMFFKPNPQENLRKSQTNNRSSQASELHRQILIDIFKSLDSNMDGKITSQDVDVSNLSSEVMEAVAELLFTLDDNPEMTMEEFIQLGTQQKVVEKLQAIYAESLQREELTKPEPNRSSQGAEKNAFKLNSADDFPPYKESSEENSSSASGENYGGEEPPQQRNHNSNNYFDYDDDQGRNMTKKYQQIARKSFNK